jgi:hypothetical protein
MAFVPKLRVLCVAFGMPGVLSSSGEFPGIARIGSCKWLDGGQVLLTVTRKAGETDLRTRHAGDPDGGQEEMEGSQLQNAESAVGGSSMRKTGSSR